MGYVVYNSSDPMELWQWRPARDPDGDFSKPSFIQDFETGPQIMEAILMPLRTPDQDRRAMRRDPCSWTWDRSLPGVCRSRAPRWTGR